MIGTSSRWWAASKGCCQALVAGEAISATVIAGGCQIVAAPGRCSPPSGTWKSRSFSPGLNSCVVASRPRGACRGNDELKELLSDVHVRAGRRARAAGELRVRGSDVGERSLPAGLMAETWRAGRALAGREVEGRVLARACRALPDCALARAASQMSALSQSRRVRWFCDVDRLVGLGVSRDSCTSRAGRAHRGNGAIDQRAEAHVLARLRVGWLSCEVGVVGDFGMLAPISSARRGVVGGARGQSSPRRSSSWRSSGVWLGAAGSAGLGCSCWLLARAMIARMVLCGICALLAMSRCASPSLAARAMV